MHFDWRNQNSCSNGLCVAAVVMTSVCSVAQRLAFGDKFRRKKQCSHCEILAVSGDHGLSNFRQLNEEGVFRPVFLVQLHWLWRRMWRHDRFGTFDSDFSHHECPERWCSLADGPFSNSSNDALSHSRSAT